MQIGYVRVSTKEQKQNFGLQVDALRNAGCEKVSCRCFQVATDKRRIRKK